MNSIIIAVLELSGYLLPVPSLIWGWAVWWKLRPRFGSPMWRYVAVILGLTIASVVGLSVLFVISHVSGMPESETRYSFAMKSSARGFVASAIALLLSLVGKGSVRLPSSLASFGLAALWIAAALLY
jgi:hypothetical protein